MIIGFESQKAPASAYSQVVSAVTASTFDWLVVRGRGPIVVEFMSYGCAHCRALEPALRRVAEIVRAKQTFFRVNVETDPELADAFAIRATPTLIMFRDGRKVGMVEGPRPKVAALLTAVAQPFRALS